MMRNALVLVCAAALAAGGCSKKKSGSESAPKGGSDTAPTTQPKPTENKGAPATTGTPKTCEELGGTKAGDTYCNVKTSPFETSFTGKFEGTMMREEPGAVFKVTNKSDMPLNV